MVLDFIQHLIPVVSVAGGTVAHVTEKWIKFITDPGVLFPHSGLRWRANHLEIGVNAVHFGRAPRLQVNDYALGF